MVQAFQFKPGWSYNETRIATAVASMRAAGCTVGFGDAQPQLDGHWKRLQSRGETGIFAQDDEEKLLGHWRDTNEQARGTCVLQGNERGAEDTYNSRVRDGVIVGDYSLLAAESAYGFMRKLRWGATHQWGCQCGNCPDGMMSADFAEFAATKGLIKRGLYGHVDLSRPREDLAITWNNTGVPADIVAAGESHKFSAHSSRNFNQYADAIAGKYFGAICLPEIFTGQRQDKYGCCEPDGMGGHCTECCGTFVLPTGETAFVIQQSWPLGAVHYSPTVQTASGPKHLRPGSYPVRQSVFEGIMAQYRDRVELWSYDIASENSYRLSA